MSRRPVLDTALDPAFAGRLAETRRGAARPVEPAELERVVANVLGSLSGGMTLGDLQLYREVESLGDYIQTARRELAALHPAEISLRHIPTATDELDAVVAATAEAADTVLGAMETIEGLAAMLPPEAAATIRDLVVKVYEACGFQDITGQRITKVVNTLRHIERKVDALLAVFEGRGGEAAGEPEPAVGEAEPTGLLNGPALPQSGNSQADIDALLASFD